MTKYMFFVRCHQPFYFHRFRSTLTTLSKGNKRWIEYGIALNHVLVPSIRPVLEQEILKEYNDLKSNHHIDVQITHRFPVPKYPNHNAMKYENINGNHTKLIPPHFKKYDYSKFDYKVTSHVDFAKLFLQSHMTKFSAFDKTCDASAVLNLLGKIPVFSSALQNAANIVREGRNAWAHCNFTEWTEANFKTRFDEMKQLVREVGSLPPANVIDVLSELRDWEDKGITTSFLNIINFLTKMILHFNGFVEMCSRWVLIRYELEHLLITSQVW